MANFNETQALKSFSRVGYANTVSKTLTAPKTAIIGIKLLGKIDYLVNHCGYHLVWDNSVNVGRYSKSDDISNKRYSKKDKKEHQLTDKTKKHTKRNNNG